VIQTVVDFIAPVRPAERQSLLEVLAVIGADPVSNAVLPLGKVGCLHFSSLVVFDDPTGPPLSTPLDTKEVHSDAAKALPPCLVFECNSDLDVKGTIAALVTSNAKGLHQVFSHCEGYDAPETSPSLLAPYLTSYLAAHARKPNAWHIANVGRSVQRIFDEQGLREGVAGFLDGLRAKDQLPQDGADVHQAVVEFASARFPWALTPAPRMTKEESDIPQRNLNIAKYASIAAAVILVLAEIIGVKRSGPKFLLTLLPLLGLAGLLRWKESHDPERLTPADPNLVRALEATEDLLPQNHLASLIYVKPGRFRRTVISLVLWVVNLLARTATDGYLGSMVTIHFAHWTLLDDNSRLLFFSNYDNSWGGYLDDFTDKASNYLTMIWSNTVWFPLTKWLAVEGASNGIRFKAWARTAMSVSNVWYTAYPDLSVLTIQRNSDLRDGLSKALTGDDLTTWLRLL